MTTGRDLNSHQQSAPHQQHQYTNRETRPMPRNTPNRPPHQSSPHQPYQYYHGEQNDFQQPQHSFERNTNGQRMSGISNASSGGIQLVDHSSVERRADSASNSKEKPPISAQLLLPILIRPILLKIERRDRAAAEKLKIALMQAENRSPGIIYELVLSLLKKCTSASSYQNDQRLGSNNPSSIVSSQSPRSSSMVSINLIESLLRLQGVVPELEEFKVRRPEDVFQDLNRKASMLKKILSRIPDEISDRRTFLETIKEIASAIKKLLDVVNTIQSGASLGGMHPATPLSQQDVAIIERRKRDFIKYSKSFSDTLKNFFRDGSAQSVFVSACQLILQTNAIQVAIKGRVEGIKNSSGGDGPSYGAHNQRPNQNAINAMNQIMDEMRL